MAAEDRLTAERLAALAPGDPVVIETSGNSGRPRRSAGTVVRISGSHIVVSCCSPRGVKYLQDFGRRDGVSVGGARRSELVDLEPAEPVTTDQRRRLLVVDAAYRQWARDRADVEKLRRLQDAIGECLAGAGTSPPPTAGGGRGSRTAGARTTTVTVGAPQVS